MPGNTVKINNINNLEWYVGDGKMEALIAWLDEHGVREKPVVITVKCCARCQGIHEDMEFEKLVGEPIDGVEGDYTHWAMCPVKEQPIVLAIVSAQRPHTKIFEVPDRSAELLDEVDTGFKNFLGKQIAGWKIIGAEKRGRMVQIEFEHITSKEIKTIWELMDTCKKVGLPVLLARAIARPPEKKTQQPKTLKVRLHSNDKKAAEATDATIQALRNGGWLARGGDGEIRFDEKGLATIEVGDLDFMRFAIVRQGYVAEIVD